MSRTEQMERSPTGRPLFGFGEMRVAHEQNLVLADVEKEKLFALWEELRESAGLATPNAGMLTDIICCPGGDYCSLANAKSIPVAEAIQRVSTTSTTCTTSATST
jgi:sulfite reductase (NADPH) hemoprotein beta-component